MSDSLHSAPAPLARDGGTPVRTVPLPTFLNLSGRRIDDEEAAAVHRVLSSGMLSSTFGLEVKQLEAEFGELIGAKHVVGCSSGTAALHLAVAAIDPNPGDEIITTPLSDMGTVIPILAQNAVPVFADVDPLTGNIDPDSVERLVTPRTRAVIVVHLFGKPAALDTLREICDRHDLKLIEDCAQAYLAPYGDRMVGTIGDIGCFSLQQSKHITAGDGGMAVTEDPHLSRRMRLFADKGWPRDSGERTNLFLGVNYRMTELIGAVARVQLRKLRSIVDDRRATAATASLQLRELSGITPPSDSGDHVYWQYPVLVDPAQLGTATEWAEALTAEGIPVAAGYLPQPLFDAPVLRDRVTYGTSGFPLAGRSNPTIDDGYARCPQLTELMHRRLLVVPWNENYTATDVDDIVAAFRKVHAVLRSEEHK